MSSQCIIETAAQVDFMGRREVALAKEKYRLCFQNKYSLLY